MARDSRAKKAAATGGPPDATLTVKAGGKEIRLEARPEIVRAELDRVLDRLFQPGESAETEPTSGDPAEAGLVEVSVAAPSRRNTQPESRLTAGTDAAARAPALDFVTRARGRENLRPAAVELLRQAALDPVRYKDLYSVDPRGKVRLRAMPATARPREDLLLLLLYGRLTLRGRARVTGGELVEGARSLGWKLGRVPRKFGLDDERVAVTGRHRGKRYRLTAAGVRHCEALIGELLAQ